MRVAKRYFRKDNDISEFIVTRDDDDLLLSVAFIEDHVDAPKDTQSEEWKTPEKFVAHKGVLEISEEEFEKEKQKIIDNAKKAEEDIKKGFEDATVRIKESFDQLVKDGIPETSARLISGYQGDII